MAKVYTSRSDEDTIARVLRSGFRAHGHKWAVLRVALALSLKQKEEPLNIFDQLDDEKAGECTIGRLTGQSQGEADGFVDAFRALLSIYHKQDLLHDDKLYTKLLQRHVRRGLKEIETSWRETHDFHEFLLQEFFSSESCETVNRSQSENVLTQLVQALEELGIEAKILKNSDGPRVTRYTLKLADAVDFSRLERRIEDLEFTLGIKDAGIFLSPAGEPKVVWLDIPRPANQWNPIVAELIKCLDTTNYGLPIFLGVDITGDKIIRDLIEAPHVLIAGTTGSGKSICLHSIILSLLSYQSQNKLKVLLIDPKRVEFSAYQGIPHLMTPVITESIEANRWLNKLVDEMDSREKLLASRNAREWRDLGDLAPPRLVIVIEELADLLAQVPEAEGPIVRLAQKSRAAGMHLILATQRPDAATLSGLLRSNVPSRISLTVQKAADSRIILDEPGAEKLLGKGDMLVKWLGESTVRVHGPYIRLEDILDTISQLGKEN